jgi:hypothetical protein
LRSTHPKSRSQRLRSRSRKSPFKDVFVDVSEVIPFVSVTFQEVAFNIREVPFKEVLFKVQEVRIQDVLFQVLVSFQKVTFKVPEIPIQDERGSREVTREVSGVSEVTQFVFPIIVTEVQFKEAAFNFPEVPFQEISFKVHSPQVSFQMSEFLFKFKIPGPSFGFDSPTFAS